MIKNKILKLFLLAAIFGGTMFLSPAIARAVTCYTETGPLRVAPDTRSCPEPGLSSTSPPFSSYRQPDGATISSPLTGANVNNCYYLSLESGGTGIFVRAGCSDLETLRTNAREELCENSGGTWEVVGTPGSPTARVSCNCPSNMDNEGGECVRGDDGGGGAGAISDEDGGKIIEWVQLAINVLTGLAGLAITAAVIVGGIQYSTSGGNPQAASAAKKRITNALLALLAMVFLYSFLQWIVPGGAF